MNKIFLITRPKHDETTHYLFYWSKKVIELAKRKGIQVLDLQKERANKKELTSIVKKKEPHFIFFNGHGSSSSIKGHDNEVLVKTGDNERLFKDRVIYALSCRSGKELGPKSIEQKTIAYIGYDDDFVFVIDNTKIYRPLDDSIAELFLKPSNQVAICILKGNKIKEAYRRSQRLFAKNIQKLLTSESSPNSVYIRYLLWDMHHQVCLGNEEFVF
ncbi:hypothetical protein KKE74_01535 [Patescibacteria group bacterium]|nr:hypothetical protein [Patescibacteria group bacterium]